MFDFDGGDQFWFYLIAHHPDSAEKIGPGIVRFLKRPSPHSRSQHALYVERKDGTVVDFSWVRCITGRSLSPMVKLTKAMRDSILDDNRIYRNMRVKTKSYHCDKCERTFQLEVDHREPTFIKLRNDFISGQKYLPSRFGQDELLRYTFSTHDHGFRDAWICSYSASHVTK
jgi:hypothetical protein